MPPKTAATPSNKTGTLLKRGKAQNNSFIKPWVRVTVEIDAIYGVCNCFDDEKRYREYNYSEFIHKSELTSYILYYHLQ